MIESISAVTLATHDMARAVRFYRTLGFEIVHGGDNAEFTSFRAGKSFLNLISRPAEQNWSWWGRVIFYHSDVDTLYANVIAVGYRPDTAPRDAEWGERFFHLTDPDGHELGFAWPLKAAALSYRMLLHKPGARELSEALSFCVSQGGQRRPFLTALPSCSAQARHLVIEAIPFSLKDRIRIARLRRSGR